MLYDAGRAPVLVSANARELSQGHIAGHAFIQNIRRGHYELGVDEPATLQVMAAFDELALAISPTPGSMDLACSASPSATTPFKRP
jgi:hypothetical protein